MPLLLSVILRCDGRCGRETTAELVFHSMLDWDLKHEDGWEVEQLEVGKEQGVTKYQTKAWCSKNCKECA